MYNRNYLQILNYRINDGDNDNYETLFFNKNF